jgi:hypothetical protein
MAAMMNPRMDVERYTDVDFSRAERKMRQLQQFRRRDAQDTVPEVARRRTWIRRPVPVTRAAATPA